MQLSRTVRFSAALLCITLVAVGCASRPSVTEHQCKAGDWETVGFRDGANGSNSTQLLRHQDACGPYNIVPNRSDYLFGWKEGIATYCTTENGFDLGVSGARFNSVCNDRSFRNAFEEGRDLHHSRAAVSQAHQALLNAEDRLAAVKRKIVGASTAQLVPDLSFEERAQLVARLSTLMEERDALNQDIPRLAAELDAREAELEAVERSLSRIAYAG